MRFLSRLFGALACGHEFIELWDEENGAPAGSAGAAGAAVQVQVPAGESATVEATPAGATVSTPARNEAGQFTSSSQQQQGEGQQQQPTGAAATVQVTATPAPQPGLNAEQLATLRTSLVEANPHAVPELIQGTTFEELIASVPTAREAHQRIASQVQEAAAASVTRGGGTGGEAIDPDSLSGEAKIGIGLQQNRTR